MPLDIARIQALCFDVDGTLRDTDDQMVLRISRRLTPLRFLFPRRDPEAFARWFVMTVETPGNFVFSLPDRVGLDDELAAANDWLFERGLRREKAHQLMIIAGVQESLALLGYHFPMSVVTARGKRGTMAFIAQHDLGQHFKAVASAQTCARTKPFPDPVLWTAEQMGVPPENCLMIGDTTVDMRAGKAAGAQTVGVLSGFGAERELLRTGADLILPSVAELPSVLLENS
ncbi:MAG: HAD family hydrolase [Anaerolineales bacterium]|nr:HAD family hydrolase [Anaerolineales bacterium]